MFSHNLNDELNENRFEKWISTVNRAAQLTNTNEIHIRCHPRTSKMSSGQSNST